MAISKAHYGLMRELNRRGILPVRPKLLEIGQANYYGDFDPRDMLRDIDEFNPTNADAIRQHILRIVAERAENANLFELVRIVYSVIVEPSGITSIDLSGEESALRYDLNGPAPLPRGKYDLVIDHGTAEHIFNIANVFKIMHDAVTIGGLMIHELPFTGWIDHGFYSVQPTLIYDLAAANQYEIEFAALEDVTGQQWFEFEGREQLLGMVQAGTLPSNLLLYFAYRKTVSEPFRIPMQGVYTNGISREAKEAWMSMR